MSERPDDLRDISRKRAELVGAEVRGERHRVGLSQQQLADEAGVTRYAVQTVERGAVDLVDLIMLCSVMEVDASVLLARAMGRPSPSVRVSSPQSVRDLDITAAGDVDVRIQQG